MSGTLFLVATPIGNLSDISARAVKTLHDADFIAAEDTRVTRKLLSYLNIKKQVISYREHNQHEVGFKIISRLLNGESCALVTDAGTPAISDPGEDLVRLCRESNIKTIIIPGPCAAIAGLALSGLSSKSFIFEGFLPVDKKKRLVLLTQLQDENRTMVFYEAPHKLKRTLDDMLSIFGDRKISISRELTKIHEETLFLTISEAIAHFNNVAPRGEFVLVVEGSDLTLAHDDAINTAVKIALSYISDGITTRDAIKRAATETGCSRNELYKTIQGVFARLG
ncbi:MAG: 16S rRNA (cytidine(1402)-2'-O)-methyltransferase [Oscillospiraceae bacterium]|jgi:16S rRNA (cytidine1402-2'-O)-methyltransferase|nr:16S rRNA (cytidine(1402)-2'-O)-methyltransferase [Oscillospiraceae bacterium]